jgi:hypothetical protein
LCEYFLGNSMAHGGSWLPGDGFRSLGVKESSEK